MKPLKFSKITLFAILLILLILGIGIFILWFTSTCGGDMRFVPPCRQWYTPLVQLAPAQPLPTLQVERIDPNIYPTPTPLAEPFDYTKVLPQGSRGSYVIFNPNEKVRFLNSRIESSGGIYVIPATESFGGEFFYQGLDVDASEVVFSCLVDFKQTPCSPGAPMAQRFSIPEDQRIIIPIEFSPFPEGLHDVAIIYWLDPYKDDEDERLRSQENVIAWRMSVAVNGSTASPGIDYPIFESTQAAFAAKGIYVSNTTDILDPEYGGVYVQYDLRAKAGQLVDFYLHIDNIAAIDVDYALTGLINYQQVPLIWQGKAYTPLYTRAKAYAWQTAKISIRAPTEPGTYEFQVTSVLMPFAHLDRFRYYVDQIITPITLYFPSSVRMRLIVEP